MLQPDKITALIFLYRKPLLFILIGLILLGAGVLSFGISSNGDDKVEVLTATTTRQEESLITVEIAGAIEKAGVYKLPNNSRIEDVLIAAGGVSEEADRTWMEKSVNRAAKVSDGQKIYIRRLGEQLNSSSANQSVGDQNISNAILGQTEGNTNINTASAAELDRLPGIGPVYAQKVIDQRPYSNPEELVSKGVLPKSTFEKIKDLIAAY